METPINLVKLSILKVSDSSVLKTCQDYYTEINSKSECLNSKQPLEFRVLLAICRIQKPMCV